MKSIKTRRTVPACLSYRKKGEIMKYTHVIWDFNGTILDDVDVCIDSVNVLLSARSMPLITSREYYCSIHSFPVTAYYERLGFDFSKESYDALAVEWVDQYLSRVPQAKLHKGALEMLEYMRQIGLGRVLLSATEEDMLKRQATELGIDRCFDEICGMDNIYAHGKKSLAQKWRAEHPNAVALFVGDTDHDLEVAQAIGADCVLFSGGHQSRERLLPAGYPVINQLDELKSFL